MGAACDAASKTFLCVLTWRRPSRQDDPAEISNVGCFTFRIVRSYVDLGRGAMMRVRMSLTSSPRRKVGSAAQFLSRVSWPTR